MGSLKSVFCFWDGDRLILDIGKAGAKLNPLTLLAKRLDKSKLGIRSCTRVLEILRSVGVNLLSGFDLFIYRDLSEKFLVHYLLSTP